MREEKEEEEDEGEILQVITPLTERRPFPKESPLEFQPESLTLFSRGQKKPPPAPDLPGCILAHQGHFSDFTFLDHHQFHILGKISAIKQLMGVF